MYDSDELEDSFGYYKYLLRKEKVAGLDKEERFELQDLASRFSDYDEDDYDEDEDDYEDDDYEDDVDESNYDPYLGQDVYDGVEYFEDENGMPQYESKETSGHLREDIKDDVERYYYLDRNRGWLADDQKDELYAFDDRYDTDEKFHKLFDVLKSGKKPIYEEDWILDFDEDDEDMTEEDRRDEERAYLIDLLRQLKKGDDSEKEIRIRLEMKYPDIAKKYRKKLLNESNQWFNRLGEAQQGELASEESFRRYWDLAEEEYGVK